MRHCRCASAEHRLLPYQECRSDAHPAILHNFLREPEAQRVAIGSIRLTRKIVSRPELAQFEPVEMAPGPNVESDDEILAYARQTVITVFHQSGTCKMVSKD